MALIDKNFIEQCVELIIQKIDPSKMNFMEQVNFIKERIPKFLSSFTDESIDVNDPDLDELIKNKVVIKEDKPLIFETQSYSPWLDTKKSDIDWKFYNRYQKYLLQRKKWNWGAIQSINEITDNILNHMRDPKINKSFAVKGLVMGDIQSGKTANYAALINKAIDAGYKLIIILAGMTNDLRSQTQKRIDEEVLGYETRPNLYDSGVSKGSVIGVGEVSDASKSYNINIITNSSDSGDLKKIAAENMLTQLNDSMPPLIAVLKKNSSVLRSLNKNFLDGDIHSRTNGKLDIPVLIIDDEVDQASVNTKNTKEIEEASSINRLIRQTLKKLNKYAYVGYTATPFANVFINPYGFESEDEKDIFPEDFIICMPKPNGYSGVKEYFGITPLNDDDDALTLDLYRPIDDYYKLFDDEVQKNQKVKVDTPVVRINDSMREAFMHFIIASAVKYSRGIKEHNSMLIHIARFKNVSESMRELVRSELLRMQQEYLYNPQEQQKYRNYWEQHIKKISENRLSSNFKDNWNEIAKYIDDIFQKSINGIKIINGDSNDVCDYSKNYVGQHIIIGGNKLSRGLTLEGLIVSYYYRNSRTYDTLLQMGRWFGYRGGWIDLCRIYTVNDNVNSFINAGIAIENFKNDISNMNHMNMTPREFGLKIQYSPTLAPTSYSKMHSAVKQKISFSGSLQQLISFQKNYIQHNREITINFLNKLKNPEQRKNHNIVFKNVKPNEIIEYLRSYKECDDLVGSVSIKNWIKYIEKHVDKNELINWTVVLHSNSKGDLETLDTLGKYSINKMQRTDRNLEVKGNEENFYLKVLTTPSDFKEFFKEDSPLYKKINEYSPANEEIKKEFTSENALLTIYSVDVHKKVFKETKFDELTNKPKNYYESGGILPHGKGVIGLGIWFPESKSYKDSAVDYYVNQVYLNKQKAIEDEEIEDAQD